VTRLGVDLCGVGTALLDLTVRGDVTIDIEGSSAGLYGGAIMAHDIDLGGGKFDVSLRDTAAPCGGAHRHCGCKQPVGWGWRDSRRLAWRHAVLRGAYFLAMHVSRRAQGFLLRSFQWTPTRLSLQYRHTVRERVLFGLLFLR